MAFAQQNIHGRAEPVNDELLWLQLARRHRSWSLFNAVRTDKPLDCRRCDWKLWEHIRGLEGQRIDDRVFHYIREAGLGGVFEAGYHKLDHALITALVERWRPETHTFHFPIGEATVTLQDVQVLWGVPIDGEVFSGHWFQDLENWPDLVIEQLGFICDRENDIKGGKITLSCLARHLGDEYGNDVASLQQRARFYILFLLGGQLFVDRTSKDVSLNYLYDLIDLSRPRYYSWGTAVLACLYRNLCECAEDSRQRTIAGPLMLLQFWAWERIPYVTPIIRMPTYQYRTSYASRWVHPLSYKEVPAHVVNPFRSVFTSMREGEFNWRPYDDILDQLPEDCRRDRGGLWSYHGWMIEWSTVELHMPHRVARQFGWRQDVPNTLHLLPPLEHAELHALDRRGRHNYSWSEHHRNKIRYWVRRRSKIFVGVAGGGTAPDYMSWFLQRTVLSPVNPAQPIAPNRYPDLGARQHFFEEGLREMHNRAQDTVQRHPESQNYMQPFLNIPPRMSAYVNQEFMDYGSQHYEFPIPPAPDAAARFHPSQDRNSFYSNPHFVFGTAVTPRSSNVGGDLFNADTTTFAPDIDPHGTSSSRQGASASRQWGEVHSDDIPNDEQLQGRDDDISRPRASTSRPITGLLNRLFGRGHG